MKTPIAPSPLSIPFRRLHPLARPPAKSRPDDAGLDLFAFPKLDDPDDINIQFVIPPLDKAVIGTGIILAIPRGYYGQIFGRSGLASRGITPLGGVIDSSYRGEVRVALMNLGSEELIVRRFDRIAQLVVLPLPGVELIEVDDLDSTARGSHGFGSSGR